MVVHILLRGITTFLFAKWVKIKPITCNLTPACFFHVSSAFSIFPKWRETFGDAQTVTYTVSTDAWLRSSLTKPPTCTACPTCRALLIVISQGPTATSNLRNRVFIKKYERRTRSTKTSPTKEPQNVQKVIWSSKIGPNSIITKSLVADTHKETLKSLPPKTHHDISPRL